MLFSWLVITPAMTNDLIKKIIPDLAALLAELEGKTLDENYSNLEYLVFQTLQQAEALEDIPLDSN